MELDLRVNALGGRKTRELFDALINAGGAVVSQAELIRRLWGDVPPRDAETTLSSYVTVLRHRLEPGVAARESVIAAEGDGFRFTLVDRRRFARAV